MSQGDYLAVVKATAEGVLRGTRFRVEEILQEDDVAQDGVGAAESAAMDLATSAMGALAGCEAMCIQSRGPRYGCPGLCALGERMNKLWDISYALRVALSNCKDAMRQAAAHRDAVYRYWDSRGACTQLETVQVQQAIQWCHTFWKNQGGW